MSFGPVDGLQLFFFVVALIGFVVTPDEAQTTKLPV